ncbi:hypothetical protein CCHL11_02134 [Colletotrichum chlorophyti]|uniref:Uncharacterized protein n=1 Tax=Colletotrichum chlorophyti TaxID=708187 RepID=A0A1Q8S6Y6_9PEZI|nr:hypothetical protein CCHL11_02134 [Colletotrichum chlorophyti]
MVAYSASLRGASRAYSVDHVESVCRCHSCQLCRVDSVTQLYAREPTGVNRAVYSVGTEVLNANLDFGPSIIINQMVSVNSFMALSPDINFPAASFWSKSLRCRPGIVQPKKATTGLLNLIASGRATMNFTTTTIIGIEDFTTC